MAAALSLTMGRLGALVGNLVFGYLIDLACVVPIILFAAFLFGKKFFPFKFQSETRSESGQNFLILFSRSKKIEIVIKYKRKSSIYSVVIN